MTLNLWKICCVLGKYHKTFLARCGAKHAKLSQETEIFGLKSLGFPQNIWEWLALEDYSYPILQVWAIGVIYSSKMFLVVWYPISLDLPPKFLKFMNSTQLGYQTSLGWAPIFPRFGSSAGT